MGMDALCKCMFIIIETILNIEHEDLTCFKGNILITSLSLHWAIYWHKLFTFLHTGQLTSSEHAKWTYNIYCYICFPLCAHILYFDAAKFSIKQFSLIYFTVSVVR